MSGWQPSDLGAFHFVEDAEYQGKGLIATEALISFPLVGHGHAALAFCSHFMEFLPLDAGHLQLAHQLERGGRCRVVLTTGGGLYRYQLGDLIEETGYYRDYPLLRFVCRQAYVSDWFGEKLNDAHGGGVLQEVFQALRIAPSFAMLACDTGFPARYVLYIDFPEDDDLVARAAELVDMHLCENFHYGYARRLGELAGIRAFRVRDGAGIYLAAAAQNGQKPGDVKVPALDRRSGWTRSFSEIRRR